MNQHDITHVPIVGDRVAAMNDLIVVGGVIANATGASPPEVGAVEVFRASSLSNCTWKP